MLSEKSLSHRTKTIKIDRRSGLTPREFINEYRNPGKPVIITDFSKKWPALTKLSLEYFQENFGDREVKISGKSYKLGEFIDILRNSTKQNPAPYPCKLNASQCFSELARDIAPRPSISLPNRTGDKLLPTKYIWGLDTLDDIEVFLGGPGGEFPCLHYDFFGVHTFVSQLYGDKEFTLFRPEDQKYLYPKKDLPSLSDLENHHNPDLNKYPLFANATPTTVTISAGETIFIPSGWYHTAKSLTLTISIGFDQLCQSNWKFFMNECYISIRKSPFKAGIMSIYLAGLGALMTARERLMGMS